MFDVFCEKCGIKIAEKGNYCESCGSTTRKTIFRWNRISLPKKIAICFGIGFVAFQALNFVIAYLMELADRISG